MQFAVRVFGYGGMQQMHISQARHFTSDSILTVEEPCLWSAMALAKGETPVSLVYTGTGPDCAHVLGIEVPDGAAIRYELQPLGPLAPNTRIPGFLSRRLTGFIYLPWAAGATFSFVDAADFP